jgi:transcription elongation factor GreA
VHIIDVTQIAPTGKVIFGVTVKILNLENEQQVTYKIVGDDEADIKSGKISVSSPVARALIGKEVGDVVTIQTPAGQVEYEIDEVLHI